MSRGIWRRSKFRWIYWLVVVLWNIESPLLTLYVFSDASKKMMRLSVFILNFISYIKSWKFLCFVCLCTWPMDTTSERLVVLFWKCRASHPRYHVTSSRKHGVGAKWDFCCCGAFNTFKCSSYFSWSVFYELFCSSWNTKRCHRQTNPAAVCHRGISRRFCGLG